MVRKYIIYFLIFLGICFGIPIVFTSSFEPKTVDVTQQNVTQVDEEITESTYDYSKYNTVRLLHTKTNKVEELALDTYLYGVVSSEMPASYEEEALKAQAVVARTYTLYEITQNNKKHKNADVCDNSTCCQAWISKEERLKKWEEKSQQAYWNKIVNCVNKTQGKVITYEGKLINAFFHANSGGVTETPINVWGSNDYPYLQTVETSGEDAYSQYASTVTVTQKQLIEIIKKVHSNFEINFDEEDCIKIQEYTQGNRVKTIKIGNLNLSGVEVRTLFELKSANFRVNMEKQNIIFEVIGYGHGVGMSQTGADSLAKQKKNYEEIIQHFYKDVQIKDI